MRGARGERNGRAKLSEYQVRKLRGYLAEGWTHGQCAVRFGIARGTVGDIASRRRWSHV